MTRQVIFDLEAVMGEAKRCSEEAVHDGVDRFVLMDGSSTDSAVVADGQARYLCYSTGAVEYQHPIGVANSGGVR